jgi:hypothetical protein
LNFIKNCRLRYEVTSSSLTLWHGGNLDFGQDFIAHKGGRWEYGPGLYLTTHYGTAKKYAKGSRKLYQVVVEKGTDIQDVSLPLEKVKDFLDTYGIKAKKKEILEILQKREKEGGIEADILVNVLVNESAIKNTNTDQLRKFLVENGVDYSIVDNAFGWHERMLVLFNMKKIISKQVIKSTDKIADFDLPIDWK